MKYSVDRLYKDIVAQYVKERDSEDFILRDVQHYLKVFCYIISVAREVESGKDYEEKTVIENMLNNDNSLFSYMAKTEHSHPLGMVVSTHFRCGKGVKRGLKNGALPFKID